MVIRRNIKERIPRAWQSRGTQDHGNHEKLIPYDQAHGN
jgi:hypothetical protein